MGNIQKYIDSITVPNTEKVARFVLGGVETDIDHYDKSQLEHFILEQRPSSPKAITTICYVLGAYAKWLQDEGLGGEKLLFETRSLNKDELWKKAKPSASKKYLSHTDFLRIIRDINLYEEFNALYYTTLFRCIYEGVYNEDLSVIKNLRPTDIHGNTLTLREDNGHVYKLKVSDELAAALEELAQIHIWERKNRYGVCRVDMKGPYWDSIFKVEYRKTNKANEEGSYRFAYYARLRRIADEHIKSKMLPLQLFVSGLMHRIIVELSKNGISLEEAFADNSRNRLAHEIISKELVRCNYTTDIGNFREMVKGHLDTFI